MTFLFILLVLSFLLAKSRGSIIFFKQGSASKSLDLAFAILIFIMIMPIGLRTFYNDTFAYVKTFQESPPILEFLADPENLDILSNPLFYACTSLIRTFTQNYHIYFMIGATVVIVPIVSFIRKMSSPEDYPFSIFCYITLGTYFFSCAAMKQTIAMAILTYAIIALSERQYLKYFVVVFIAGLFHTYAWCYFLLFFLLNKPWKIKTFLVVVCTVVVMMTFDTTISTYLEYADAIGKSASEDLVFSGDKMNIFRVAVYGVTPIATLLLQKYLSPHMERKHHILIHMSILSFMFMLLASINGANMFGRMARYFELGIVCTLPWIIRCSFTRKSQRIVFPLFLIAFLAFFTYGFWGIENSYSAISIKEFIISLTQ